MASLVSLPLRVGLLAGVLLSAAMGGGLAQDRVGVSGAVNPRVTGTPPGGTARQLVIGQDVVFNERITTGDVGQTQLLFLDESAMTIGPNSDVTIDQFVYDPKSGTGKLAMSATRGVLRYVGGKLSKQDQAVTVRTNTATLAVRGGAFILKAEAAGKIQAIFIFGAGLTVTGLNNIAQTVRRAGFEIIVAGPGASPLPPSPVPPAQLAQLVAQLDGRSGGTGGAAVIPTDTFVAQSGIAQTVSGDITTSVQQAVNPTGATNFATPPSTTDTTALSLQTAASAGQTIDCVAAGTCSSGDVFPPPAPTPVAVTYTGRLRDTNGAGTSRGFADQSANGNVAYSSGTLQGGIFSGTVGGRVGTISFGLPPGTASLQGSSSGLGALAGTSFLSADNSFFYANVTPIGQPTERLFIYGGLPVNPSAYAQTGATRIFAFSVQPDAALQSNIPFVRGQVGGNLANASVSPFYIVAPPTTPIGDASTNSAARGLQVSLAINGQGANQQSTIAVSAGTIGSQPNGQPIFNGQMRGSSMMSASGTPVRLSSGVSSSVDANGNAFYGGTSISGFALDQGTSLASETPLSAAATTTYGFAQPAVATTTPSGVGTSRTTRALSGNFGGLMYSTVQNNPYIVSGGTLVSTDAPNNRMQASLFGSAQSPSSGASSMTMQYGGLSGASGQSAFVDDNTFAAIENPTLQSGTGYFASSGAAGAPPTSLLPPGASFCQCQFLQWGYWGGDIPTTLSESSATRIDRGNINTWVAGVATPLGDLNSLIGQSASASYTGAAIGSVFNNGASYLAAGGFTGTYNFGTQTGVMSVSNFDGRTLIARGSGPLTGANYTFGASTPGVQGTINGTFYGPMAAETGGSFAFQTTVGQPYLASGIYAGKR
jgi:hypothetical protein